MLIRVLLVGVATFITATGVEAQWLTLPTPNVPRTADGKANLNAPAPSGPDGHPLLSGLWNSGERRGNLRDPKVLTPAG